MGVTDLVTAGAVEALGISHYTGQVGVGRRAGLLVVDGDPLAGGRGAG
ncbi:hypothetical protein [Streptomyces sp. NPDC051567]